MPTAIGDVLAGLRGREKRRTWLPRSTMMYAGYLLASWALETFGETLCVVAVIVGGRRADVSAAASLCLSALALSARPECDRWIESPLALGFTLASTGDRRTASATRAVSDATTPGA